MIEIVIEATIERGASRREDRETTGMDDTETTETAETADATLAMASMVAMVVMAAMVAMVATAGTTTAGTAGRAGGTNEGASMIDALTPEVVALVSVWRVLRGAREELREAAMSDAMADRLIVDIKIGESTERAMVVEEVPVVGAAAATAAATAAAMAAAMAAVTATAGVVHGHGGPHGRRGRQRGGGGSGRGERQTAGEVLEPQGKDGQRGSKG